MPNQRGEGRWMERAFDEIDAAPRPKPRQSTAVNFPPALQELVRRAAEQRGLSVAAFVRRAAAAVAAHDLELDWREVMAEEPRIRGYGETSTDPVWRGGAGHGPWEIIGMENGG